MNYVIKAIVFTWFWVGLAFTIGGFVGSLYRRWMPR